MTSRGVFACLAILAVAGWLRFHDLSTWSLDGDELFSHYDVQEIMDGQEWPQGARSHPIGYAVMAASVALAGPGEWSLRLPSALLGLAAVAALLLSRRDVIPRREALLAAALAAISPWLIYHAQEARFYGPLFACATFATVWALPGPGRRPVLAGGFALAAALCHPTAVLLLPCLAVSLFESGTSRRRVLTVTGLLALAVALWLLLGDRAVVDVIVAAIEREGYADYDAAHFVLGLGYNLGLGIGALAAAGLLAVLRAPRQGDRTLLACALAPPAILLVLGLLGVNVQQRYAMASIPAALLLAGRGGASLAGRPLPALALGALAVLAPLPELVSYARTGDRHDYREAAAWVASNVSDEDILVVDEHAILDLYLQAWPGDRTTMIFEAPPADQQMQDFLGNRRDIWVLVKRNRMGSAYGPGFGDWLQRHFDEVAEIGEPPLSLARHDNRLVILKRRERVVRRP
ncbi:MAG: glycosyltransferase family 39 protein [Planctomycetota bacterium]